jgi:hypothetical protein
LQPLSILGRSSTVVHPVCRPHWQGVSTPGPGKKFAELEVPDGHCGVVPDGAGCLGHGSKERPQLLELIGPGQASPCATPARFGQGMKIATARDGGCAAKQPKLKPDQARQPAALRQPADRPSVHRRRRPGRHGPCRVCRAVGGSDDRRATLCRQGRSGSGASAGEGVHVRSMRSGRRFRVGRDAGVVHDAGLIPDRPGVVSGL